MEDDDFDLENALPGDGQVHRFVSKVFRDAVQRKASRIRFTRSFNGTLPVRALDSNWNISEKWGSKCFSVLTEHDGKFQKVAAPPLVLWASTISRIKALAGMVDYGPKVSKQGEFNLDSEANGNVIFRVTSNPNPYQDTELTIEVIIETDRG